MDAMPRPRPPYLQREVTRHGKTLWYVRRDKGPRIRINGAFGSPEFMTEYHRAVAGQIAATRPPPVKTNTLRWLLARYRESAAWAKLSPATRRQRENIFLPILKSAGDEPFAAITKQDIAKGVDRRAATPFAAANFVKAMRGLFQWAMAAGHVEQDPTRDASTTTPKTDGFHAWTEDEIAQFEARWPIGTRERLALALFLFTGLRRGDVARLGRQHVRNGVITIRTEKTGTAIILPILPALQEIIDASPTGDLVFLASERGKPMTKESLGNWFRDACDAAGVPGSAHGLRKAGATRLANNGATVAQLEAIYGWEGGKMASLYTRTADRARLAREAISKLEKPETGTSIPEPAFEVRASERKSE
ncbi:tyrosine-type recombinase/integrase [Rhodoblastus sp.]|uniref:tyrosine-type recombinase/integrase n=1 Tax=Rhodoblastus sp. TaxID=1962975 RepID=UPI002635F17F|nr:tyrosine-type recombinase/integrase [Rhodoblastus sp.]